MTSAPGYERISEIPRSGVEVNDPGSHAYYGGGRDVSGIEIPEPGATYYFRVQARNAQGYGPKSDVIRLDTRPTVTSQGKRAVIGQSR